MKIDKGWTLFLDRDGVINEDHVGGYVLTLEEIRLMPGAKEALVKFARLFGTIVICTNQRSIGKGLLTVETFHRMNALILSQIKPAGGRIDKIYYAPDLDTNAFNRKPQPGMALQAKRDFPQIDFSKSMMVGNNLSDMEFGRNAGISKTIFLTTTVHDTVFPHLWIDEHYHSLKEFSDTLE